MTSSLSKYGSANSRLHAQHGVIEPEGWDRPGSAYPTPTFAQACPPAMRPAQGMYALFAGWSLADFVQIVERALGPWSADSRTQKGTLIPGRCHFESHNKSIWRRPK